MADPEQPEVALRRLIDGYQVSQAIHVAASLGLADLLGAGPRSSDDLADATGAHGQSLYRLMRALASAGIFHEGDGRIFELTPLGEGRRSGAPGSLRDWAAFVGRPYYREAWSSLAHSVRTGENAFRHVHGMDVWSFRAEHPEEGALFDAAMTALIRQANRSLLEAYDFARFASIVDVGGGNGAFLVAILQENPGMTGVLFDQPHVVGGAESLVRAAGLADRCERVGGSFFDSVPPGGEAYVLKSIIHDWEDAEAAEILRTCRSVVAPGGALLVIERVLGPPNEDPATKFSDLNMLVSPGGRERTIEEFAALFESAGFRLVAVTPSASGLEVIEAAPA